MSSEYLRRSMYVAVCIGVFIAFTALTAIGSFRSIDTLFANIIITYANPAFDIVFSAVRSLGHANLFVILGFIPLYVIDDENNKPTQCKDRIMKRSKNI